MRNAEDNCISTYGGHLASAHSQADADAFNDMVSNTAWIGYHDMGNEAGCTDDRHQGIGGEIAALTFVWTDATPSDYENWAGGEPNDWQDGQAMCDGTGNEDCTETWRGGQDWNDANCDGVKPYICGVCPNHGNIPTYFEFNDDAVSKPDAEFNCILAGGHLASLHSQDDQDLLNDMVANTAWIGYHDRSAEAGCTDDRHQGIGGEIMATSFIWTDGTASDYENWAGGEPNDWQDGQAMCDGTGNEDCTEMWRGGQDWNDANCDGNKPYICGFIGGAPPEMCSGAAVPAGNANQLITFGCIDHETVQCTYNANDGGGDYAASMAAFAACRDASVGVDGYCRQRALAASGLSNQDACGGPNTNIAFHTLIPFTAQCAGIYHFRFHADYGYGGFLGVDGVSHSAGDIWGHVFARTSRSPRVTTTGSLLVSRAAATATPRLRSTCLATLSLTRGARSPLARLLT